MHKIIVLIFSLLICSVKLNAQIGYNKAKLIKLVGYNYIEGKTEDNVPYIYYVKDYVSPIHGPQSKTTSYYFYRDKNELVCFLKKVFMPASEINAVVNHFNNRGYVKIDELTWKNYETNIIYSISLEGGYCIMTARID